MSRMHMEPEDLKVLADAVDAVKELAQVVGRENPDAEAYNRLVDLENTLCEMYSSIEQALAPNPLAPKDNCPECPCDEWTGFCGHFDCGACSVLRQKKEVIRAEWARTS